MNIEECYRTFGGNYQDVKSRLMKDELIQRLVIKFLADTSYEKLSEAMSQADYGEAFRAVHTLKGVSANLGLGRLLASAGELTELLRTESEAIPEAAFPLLETVKQDYELTVGSIRNYLEEETLPK